MTNSNIKLFWVLLAQGKTYTMANIIAQTNKTTLILAPNKTLAAQLYAEMREFFPKEFRRIFCFLL